jgi:hypothetical protein
MGFSGAARALRIPLFLHRRMLEQSTNTQKAEEVGERDTQAVGVAGDAGRMKAVAIKGDAVRSEAGKRA